MLSKLNKLIKLFDKIVLNNRCDDVDILSGEFVSLLDPDIFDGHLKTINAISVLFEENFKLYYVLIKFKHFKFTENIITFIIKVIYHYINNDKDKFYEVMNNVPHYYFSNETVSNLWKKYDEKILTYIFIYSVFPYILESTYGNKKICSYCSQLTDVDFIRCYECRLFYYCSNSCQRNDYWRHKKTCIHIYSLD
jgi:hypothetical protein